MFAVDGGPKITLVCYLMKMVVSQKGTKIKQRYLMTSLPLSSTLMMGSGGHRVGGPSLQYTQLPVNPEPVQDLLLQVNAQKSMWPNGIHPRELKKLTDVIQLFFSGLGNLVRSQLTGSWQTLSFQEGRERRPWQLQAH